MAKPRRKRGAEFWFKLYLTLLAVGAVIAGIIIAIAENN